MAAGAAPFVMDLAGGAFAVPEAVGRILAKGGMKMLEKAAVNAATKRAVGSGISKAVAEETARAAAGRRSSLN